MEKAYATTDPVAALHTALTFASLTVREIKNLSDAPGVTNVYFTRYEALQGNTFNAGDVASLGADPTAQYAVESKTPPTDGSGGSRSPKLARRSPPTTPITQT